MKTANKRTVVAIAIIGGALALAVAIPLALEVAISPTEMNQW